MCSTHCSRINRYGNFISWDFFHLSSFIHNGDNLDMQENLRFYGEILRNLKICKWGNFFDEFYIIYMQKLINFKKKEVKYIRIFQDLKKIVQDSQKCSQKGHFESWAPIGSWNLSYNKSCIFSKELIWQRSFQQESAGNWSLDFRVFCSEI